jgi:polysaccharide biosynthesis/export protein
MSRHKVPLLLILSVLLLAGISWAENDTATQANTNATANTATPATSAPVLSNEPAPDQSTILIKDTGGYSDPSRYTLGPDDVIQIDVQRHPEFSGVFPVNMEGRIQLKFAGDVDLSGLTKVAAEQKIKATISNYIINPDVTVTIMDYRSKVIYVLGEVGAPGKYYMRAETIPVREALVQAGLPTLSAAMRRCRLITPDKTGKAKIKDVDVYTLLYGGDLTKNLDMHAGDVLYVPATVMAKIVNVINPVSSAVGLSSAGPTNASSAKTGVQTLSGKAAAF